MGQGQPRVFIYINFVDLDVACQVSSSLDFLFWRIRFLKVFTINEHGSHVGHVTCTIYIYFLVTSQGGSTQNLALIGQAVSEKMFEKNGHYTCI